MVDVLGSDSDLERKPLWRQGGQGLGLGHDRCLSASLLMLLRRGRVTHAARVCQPGLVCLPSACMG